MRKITAITLVISILISPLAFAADAPKPSTTPSKMSIIEQKVQEKLDVINRAGTTGQNVEKEITFDKYKKKAVEEKPLADMSNAPKFDMITLAQLNVFAGFFEGGLIGAGIGLIGYSKSMNTDRRPLVAGSIAGLFTGAGLAAGLSLWQSISKRYSSSDDYGYDLIGGTVVGACIGAAGGLISYGKTRDLENVSEGMGWGVLVGATLGLALGTIETFIPEEYRGMSLKLRAFNIEQRNDATVLSCNIKY